MLRCTIRRELPSMFPVTRKKKKKYTQRTRRYTDKYTKRHIQKIYLYIDYNLAEIRLKQKKKKT